MQRRHTSPPYFFFLLNRLTVPPRRRYNFQPSSAPSINADAEVKVAISRLVGELISSAVGCLNISCQIPATRSSAVSSSSLNCSLRAHKASKESMHICGETLFFLFCMAVRCYCPLASSLNMLIRNLTIGRSIHEWRFNTTMPSRTIYARQTARKASGIE